MSTDLMELKEKLIHLLEYAYKQEQVFIQGLTEEERSTPGTPRGWSAKDNIVHIAAWKGRGARVLAALVCGHRDPGRDDPTEFNAKVYEEGQAFTWDQVIDKSKQAYQYLREQTEAATADILAAPEQKIEPVWWLVVGTGCTHALGHLAEYCIEHSKAPFALEIQEGVAELLLQLDGPTWKVYYGLAGTYAAAGEAEKAIDALSKAFSHNPDLLERSRADPRLASIRDHPGYRTLCKE